MNRAVIEHALKALDRAEEWLQNDRIGMVGMELAEARNLLRFALAEVEAEHSVKA